MLCRLVRENRHGNDLATVRVSLSKLDVGTLGLLVILSVNQPENVMMATSFYPPISKLTAFSATA